MCYCTVQDALSFGVHGTSMGALRHVKYWWRRTSPTLHFSVLWSICEVSTSPVIHTGVLWSIGEVHTSLYFTFTECEVLVKFYFTNTSQSSIGEVLVKYCVSNIIDKRHKYFTFHYREVLVKFDYHQTSPILHKWLYSTITSRLSQVKYWWSMLIIHNSITSPILHNTQTRSSPILHNTQTLIIKNLFWIKLLKMYYVIRAFMHRIKGKITIRWFNFRSIFSYKFFVTYSGTTIPLRLHVMVWQITRSWSIARSVKSWQIRTRSCVV